MRKILFVIGIIALLMMVACTVPNPQKPSVPTPTPQVTQKQPAPIMPPAESTIPKNPVIQPLDLSDTLNESVDDMQYYVKVT